MQNSSAKVKLGIAGLLGICGLVAVRFLPLGEWLLLFQSYTEHLGLLGPLLYILIFGLGVAALGPFSIFAAGAGFCFGVWVGGGVCWVGGLVGSVLAFILSRSILRSSVQDLASRHPFFAALDSALGGPKGGLIIFLLRLTPIIPYSISNYMYGATAVGFLPYLWASALGDLPIGFVYAYLGVAGRMGVEQATGAAPDRAPLEYVLLGVGLVAAIVVSVLLTRIAKKELEKQGINPLQGRAQTAPVGE